MARLTTKETKALLANLAEEAGEVAAIAGKTLRFGPYSIDPTAKKGSAFSNIVLIGREIGNLLHVASLLNVPEWAIEEGKKQKAERLETYKAGIDWQA